MKRLLVALLIVPSMSLGAGQAPERSEDPMAGWVPPKVKSEAKDKQEIQAVMRSMEAAMRTGDLDAAVALIDFPVLMMTDDSKGQAMGEAWERERWTEVMRPFYAKPMKDLKVTHKPSIFLVTDSLAAVNDVVTMTQGGKTITSRNSMFLVRKDGKWRVKSMAEGGWGDMMAQAEPAAAGAAEPAPSQGTGTSAEPPKGSGSTAAEPPPSQKESTGSGAATPEQPAKGGSTAAEPPPSSSGSASGATPPPSSQGSGSSASTPPSSREGTGSAGQTVTEPPAQEPSTAGTAR